MIFVRLWQFARFIDMHVYGSYHSSYIQIVYILFIFIICAHLIHIKKSNSGFSF